MRPEGFSEGENPTPAPSAGEAAAGLGVTPADRKTKWVETRGGKTYVIEVCDPSVEEGSIVVYGGLRLEEKCSGFSKVWELRWDYADALFLSKTVYSGGRSEWVGEVAVITVLPEAPWMFRYTELGAKIEKMGVRETVRAILGYLMLLAKEVVERE